MHEKLLVLIQTPYFEQYGAMRKAAGTYFPLGIGYISAYVKQFGYRVKFFDPNVQKIELTDIVEFIQTHKPILVGMSFMTPQFFTAKDIVDKIKNRLPGIPVVLGGAHPSVMPKKTLEEIPNADYIVYNEGEQTMLELIEFINQKGDTPRNIDGLVWKDGDSIVVNKPRASIDNLDKLPFPDRELIDQSMYHAQSFLSYSRKAITIYTSRGCPGKCVFCASGHTLRNRIRQRSIENVMDEIDFLRRRYDIDYLMIKDDTFTINNRLIRNFCQEIKRRHPKLRWHCMVRADTVDEEILAVMKNAGLNDVFIGIESGNNEILKKSRKGTNTKQVRSIVEACERLGIKTYGAFILGLPGDTRETIHETIDFACSLPLTMAGFSILIPYPGTKVYEDYFIHGTQINYRQFIASTGLNYVEGYTGLKNVKLDELPRLVSLAQRQFYFRPSQIMRLLRNANSSLLYGYAKGFLALISKELLLAQRFIKTLTIK